jgi:hypothetical protein
VLPEYKEQTKVLYKRDQSFIILLWEKMDKRER